MAAYGLLIIGGILMVFLTYRGHGYWGLGKRRNGRIRRLLGIGH